MLHLLQSEHFQPLLGQTCNLLLPDGSVLPVHIESIKDTPQSRMPNSPRMPFCVELNSLAPTVFVDGLCDLELPGVGHLQGMFVSRVPALGRDPTLGYFYIAFN
ncbi:DUF6916 family protein [Pseudomonas chlororaphis]|uniref:DUF6916 family protein n=1 Tax=Pseudomonas chlororaphis TaxID=587753 RepID=UPI002366FC60|nr:hypothetical protein [Pseudomonas chlororaphis]WDH23088.1 hypothetical protein PUP50_02030 [Pseudomonas chlororaphis]